MIIFSDCSSVLQGVRDNNIDVYKNPYIVEIRRIYSRKKANFVKKKKGKMALVWTPCAHWSKKK